MLSCKNDKRIEKIEKEGRAFSKKKKDSCKFSYIDKSSKFIDSIPSLKGYVKEGLHRYVKVLPNNDVLEIDRFGCNEFYMETTLILNKQINFSDAFVISKINKILDLLPNEYDTESIRLAISKQELSFFKQTENRIFSQFKNEKLDDLITIFYHLKEDQTAVSLNMFKY